MTWPKTCLGTGERDRPGRSVRRLAEQRVRQIPLTGCCARASACQLVGETPIRAVETELPVNQLHRSGLVLRFINTTTFAARDFWPRRDASDAHTLHGSVRSEQQSLGRKAPPPGGLRRFSVPASLLLGHSPTSGDAPSSRLARTENRRNKRGRIYETGYLGDTPREVASQD